CPMPRSEANERAHSSSASVPFVFAMRPPPGSFKGAHSKPSAECGSAMAKMGEIPDVRGSGGRLSWPRSGNRARMRVRPATTAQKEDPMDKRGQPYSAGDWTVKEGKEAEFIERWSSFTKWSAENAPGAESFLLIQALDNPRHF